MKGGLNLGNAIEQWLVLYKKNSVKPATYDRLVTSLDLLRKHTISDMPFEEIGSEHIQRYVNYLVNARYAKSTIKKQYFLMHAFFRSKRMDDIFDEVQLPAQAVVLKPRKEIMAYSQSEQAALRSVFSQLNHPACYAARLMLETGMRVGEVLALSWEDILWERRAVRIDKTLVRLANSKRIDIQQGAKSYSSNRTIPLSGAAMGILNEIRAGSEDSRGLIFRNEHGGFITYEAMRWHIKKACDAARVPYYGQHVFRHTFATNCYYRGCNVKILSKLLGHADVTVTYNIYIHLFGDALEEMRSVVG